MHFLTIKSSCQRYKNEVRKQH